MLSLTRPYSTVEYKLAAPTAETPNYSRAISELAEAGQNLDAELAKAQASFH